MKHARIAALALAPLAVLAGCGKDAAETGPRENPADSAASGRPAFLLAEMPEGAVPVADAKKTAREGEQIVVRGRIGGRSDPMSAGQGLFVMMDPSVPSCADDPEDECKTPWDYCCETPETIMANAATVQVTGPDGKPLKTNLSAAGLSELDEVIVVGTVGARPSPEVLVVHATGIHRVGG